VFHASSEGIPSSVIAPESCLVKYFLREKAESAGWLLADKMSRSMADVSRLVFFME